MRLVLFVLFFIPNLASADKTTRDEILSFYKNAVSCGALFDLRFSSKPEFRNSQLTMQFEIDEQMFSLENIEQLEEAFTNLIESSGMREKYNALTEDEIEYLSVKTITMDLEAKNFALSIVTDPEKLAKEIKNCVTEFGLEK